MEFREQSEKLLRRDYYLLAMCGRFFIVSGRDEIEARFDVFVDIEYTPSFNAAPQQGLYIIPNTDLAHLYVATWGYSFSGTTVINARVESASDKKMFSSAIANRRCLVIANGFIEWKDGQPFKATYSSSLVAFAGIWEMERVNGVERMHFVILTREAVGLMREYHTRMPIALSAECEKEWLTSADAAVLEKFLVPNSFKPLDKAIGNVRNNKKELLVPMRQLFD